MALPAELEPGVSEEMLRALFEDCWPGIATFHDLLAEQGEVRGLIGPRERDRLWRRHILNSAALADFLPLRGRVADIGSGAGLPGMVLALMRPGLEFHLIEPMQRRALWLEEVRALLGLGNVAVHQERAEQAVGSVLVDAVTARAVAPVAALASWSAPLLEADGRVVVLKGRKAAAEVAAARPLLRRLGLDRVEIHQVDVLSLGEATTVVELTRRRRRARL